MHAREVPEVKAGRHRLADERELSVSDGAALEAPSLHLKLQHVAVGHVRPASLPLKPPVRVHHHVRDPGASVVVVDVVGRVAVDPINAKTSTLPDENTGTRSPPMAGHKSSIRSQNRRAKETKVSRHPCRKSRLICI